MKPEVCSFLAPDASAQGGPPAHRMTYYRWGNPSLPILICVHGLSRNGRDFDTLAEALSGHFHVIAFDMPGRGKSERLENPTHYNYQTYITDVLAFIAEEELMSLSWVGTSMGGIMGMMLAASTPGLIQKMVINDVGPFIKKEALHRISEYVGVKSQFVSEALAKEYITEIMQPFGVDCKEDWEHIYLHNVVMREDGTAELAYDPAIAWIFKKEDGSNKSVDELEDVNLWPMWQSITTPMMIIRGQQSDLLDDTILTQMKEHPLVQKVLEVPEVGHAPMLMKKREIEPIKQWLTN